MSAGQRAAGLAQGSAGSRSGGCLGATLGVSNSNATARDRRGGGGGVLLQFRFDLLSLECSLRTCIPGNASASGDHILGKKSGMFSRPDGELWEQ